ncbi:hypothetical protein CACET_c18280 [Clostridium aceticum]|uniref:Uncharacterized protein n=1 Tax=Clostridium aceticum TaxID=84022 RepID=A0A0D8IDF2_9CLOT|nr:hypothetical protein [Clostridium aceticum]AKL95276.1 hypothetical protein CACET_c18280 [Clostridium aceticum]KJF28124.1 hypothetical protein TZ02_06160 [Clostridium aceticum]
MKILRSNKGFILPLTMIIFLVLVIFSLSILRLVNNQGVLTGSLVNTQTKTKGGLIAQEKALQYAEAGYSAYLWKLNDHVNFYLTQESQDMLGVPIPYENGYYQLDVTWPSDQDRYVTIISTGWSKDSSETKRTIQVQLQKKQFVHQVYVSQEEGTNIYFGGSDKLYGPVHTNGILKTMSNPGPEFFNTVTYTIGYQQQSGANPKFHRGPPQQVDELVMQKTNSELKAWAELDGTVFMGRTCIHLEGDKIRVKYPNPDDYQPASYPNNNTGYIEKVIDIPPNGVIYIDGAEDSQGRPIGSKWEPRTGNLFIAGTLSGELTIAAKNNIYITHSNPTEWYDDHDWNSDGIYYYNQSVSPPSPPSFPANGGIYYQNTAFTLNPTTGNVTISGKGKDMLGLIANNYIYIMHYGWPRDGSDGNGHYWRYQWRWRNGWWSGFLWQTWNPGRWERYNHDDRRYDVAPTNIHIHATVFALNQGFGFEEYTRTPGKNMIYLWGNITQYERYAVRQGSSGYGKQYVHDPRMFYHYPPHILEPVNSGWEVRDWKELN